MKQGLERKGSAEIKGKRIQALTSNVLFSGKTE